MQLLNYADQNNLSTVLDFNARGNEFRFNSVLGSI